MYRARGAAGGDVAVKLLAPSAELDAAARARFAREIEVLAGLEHPHLLRLLDHGVDPELGPYLVTPLCPGASLRALAGGRRLCPEAALLWLDAGASAAEALHARALAHRDLKPENLLATPDGDLVVVDLGLALGPGHSRHTEEGAVVGSVPYMAPEQLEGGGDLGPAVDVWALGVLTYEWIAGARPFQRERPSEEAAAALVGRPAPLDAADRRVSVDLAELVAACLAPEPGDRPSATALRARVSTLLDWCDPADHRRERAAIAADPEAYQQRVAPLRVRRLVRRARLAHDAGQPFRALRLVDRALAYRGGDDPELEALADELERATAGAEPAARAPAAGPPRHRRRLQVAGAIAALGAAALAGALLGGARAPAAAPTTAPTAAPKAISDEAVLGLAGGMLDLFQRQMALEEQKRAASEPAPLPALAPIPRGELANDAPPATGDLAAAPGEPLLPRDRLGGRSPGEVLAELERDLAAHPGDLELRLGRALVLLASERPAEGLAELAALGREHPGDAAVWAARGYVATRQGRWAEADAALGRAVELDPSDATPLRNRGILRHRLGRTRDAYDDLVAALAIDPGDVEALSELAQIYERAGRRGDARPLLERVLRARPGDADLWIDLSLTQPLDEALASVRRALAIAPGSARALGRLCAVQAQRQDPAAVEACSRALAAAPGDPDHLMHRGLARYHGGDGDAALVDMDRAVELAPRRATFRTNRYLVRRHAGHPGALEDLRAGCELGSSEACAETQKSP